MATTERAEPGREELLGELQARVEEVTSRLQLGWRMREKPYPVLGIAFGAGYMAGGGAFSRVSRPLSRALLGALLWPWLRRRAAGLAEGLCGKLVSPDTAQA